MTGIAQFAQLSTVDISKVKAKIRLTLGRSGSILGGTIQVHGAVATEWEVEAPTEQDIDKVKQVLLSARDGCWTHQMTENATDFQETILLNGQPVD